MQTAVVELPEAPDFLEVGIEQMEGVRDSPLGARFGYLQDRALGDIDAVQGDNC
jgi:hypothetical protein